MSQWNWPLGYNSIFYSSLFLFTDAVDRYWKHHREISMIFVMCTQISYLPNARHSDQMTLLFPSWCQTHCPCTFTCTTLCCYSITVTSQRPAHSSQCMCLSLWSIYITITGWQVSPVKVPQYNGASFHGTIISVCQHIVNITVASFNNT